MDWYNKIKSGESLTFDEEKLLFEQVKKKNNAACSYLLSQYSNYIGKIVDSGFEPLAKIHGREVLIGSGMLGLFQAAVKYDPDQQIKFKHFARKRIVGAIFDELNRYIPGMHIPENKRKPYVKYLALRDSISNFEELKEKIDTGENSLEEIIAINEQISFDPQLEPSTDDPGFSKLYFKNYFNSLLSSIKITKKEEFFF